MKIWKGVIKMTKKIKNSSICSGVWLVIMLLPFIVFLGWVIVNQKNGSGVIAFNEYINYFNQMFGDMGFINDIIIKLFSIFEVDINNKVIIFASSYVSYFVLIYLINIAVDLLLFIPKFIKGVFKNE